ncbi:MAG: metallopeptidase family protein [Rhodospirillales bacterium]|nr:metallopeptidase family protein [Rhodospirillales bacterium]
MAESENLAPDLAEIERLAEKALAAIPPELARHVRDVVLRVEDFCDEETEREMGLDSPYELMGLYRGIDMMRDSTSTVRTQPDMIFLYRRPLLDYWCESGEDLAHVVRHVMIHEIGHHFGFSDDDMERIEAAADLNAERTA